MVGFLVVTGIVACVPALALAVEQAPLWLCLVPIAVGLAAAFCAAIAVDIIEDRRDWRRTRSAVRRVR
jgi:hypothetical protein